MDLLATAEQEAIVAATADVLQGEWPVSRLHQPNPHLTSLERRRQMADQGWFGMALPEAQGGVGLSIVEEALVMIEMGRSLAPTTVLHAALAARVALAHPDPVLAQKIMAGEEPVALLVSSGPVAVDGQSVNAVGYLYDFEGARIALCMGSEEFLLLELEGSEIRKQPCWDRSVTMARFTGSNARVLARQACTQLRPVAELLTAAQLLGIAEAVLAMIVEYAQVRQTFGKPIGSNQAVRHPCADMAARCEMVRAQLYYAAVSLRDGAEGAEVHAAAARVIAQNAAMKNVDSNIQLHGGIGVTDEHDAHLYLKRAHLVASWYGTSKVVLQRLLTSHIPAL